MATLSAISNEIRTIIIEHIDQASILQTEHEYPYDGTARDLPRANVDLLNLSCVNRCFRELAAPFFFRSLILRDTTKSGAAVARIANSRYAQFVKRLEFVGYSTISSSPQLIDDNLPTQVKHLISNLFQFPNLDALSITFSIGRSADDFWEYFNTAESDAHILAAEANEAWRALINAVYAATSLNPPGTIKTLALNNIIPKRCSAWQTPAWHALLAGLTSFSLRFAHDENNSYSAAVTGSWHEFSRHAEANFWTHLCNTTHLSIFAAPDAMLGHDTVSPFFPCGTALLPKLETLSVENVLLASSSSVDAASNTALALLGNGVLDTLIAHATTLKSVRLGNVYVARSNDWDALRCQQMSWARAFTVLSSAGFHELVEFHVFYSGAAEDQDEIGEALVAREEQRGASEAEVGLKYVLVDYECAEVMLDFDVEEQRGAVVDRVGMRGSRTSKEAEPGLQADLDRLAFGGFKEIVDGNRRRLGVL